MNISVRVIFLDSAIFIFLLRIKKPPPLIGPTFKMLAGIICQESNVAIYRALLSPAQVFKNLL
jgi:hypothetical protein